MLPTHNQLQKMPGAPRSKAITIPLLGLARVRFPAGQDGWLCLGRADWPRLSLLASLLLWFFFLLWRAEARHRKTLEAWYLDNWVDLEAATLLSASTDTGLRRR